MRRWRAFDSPISTSRAKEGPGVEASGRECGLDWCRSATGAWWKRNIDSHRASQAGEGQHMRRAPPRLAATRHLWLGLAAVAVVLIGGTVGYMVTEGLSPLD